MSSASPSALLAPVHGEHLLAQLAGPLPFRLTRSFDTETRMLLMAQRLLLAAQPALQLASLRLGVRERLFQAVGMLLGRAALPRRTGNRQQRSGSEAKRQDVIERIEGIAAAHAEDK